MNIGKTLDHIHHCRTCSTFIDGSPAFSAPAENRRETPGWMEWGDSYCAAKPARGGVMRWLGPFISG